MKRPEKDNLFLHFRIVSLIIAAGAIMPFCAAPQSSIAREGNGLGTSSWGLVWDKARHVALTVDSQQSIYLVGICHEETDLDPTEGEFRYTPTSRWGAGYILKISGSGELTWARTWEATEYTLPSDIAVDSTGAVYVTGLFLGTVSFDGETSVVAPESQIVNPCLLRLDSSGDLEWMYSVEGEETGRSQGTVVAVDPQDNVYLAGTYNGSPRFELTSPPPSIANWREPSSTTNTFLVKLDSSGSVKWARKWAGVWTCTPDGIAVDRRGNVCVAGTAGGSAPSMGWQNHGEVDFEVDAGGFLVKFDTYGFPEWVDSLDSRFGTPCDVGFDPVGRLYVTGTRSRAVTEQPDSPVETGNVPAPTDATTLYVAEYTRDRNYQMIESLDGDNTSIAGGLAVDSQMNVYVAGSYWHEVDLDPGSGEDRHAGGPYWNNFVIKGLPYMGSFTWSSAHSYGFESSDCDVALDAAGNVYVIGACSTDSAVRLTKDFTWEGELGENSWVLFKLNPTVFQ